MRSCINYNTFRKLNVQLTQGEVPKVIGADGGDLGSMGTVQLTLIIGSKKVTQKFIVCRELRRNIILGVDFAKRNCAGIQWTTNRTRVLSLNGIKAVEVEEDAKDTSAKSSEHLPNCNFANFLVCRTNGYHLTAMLQIKASISKTHFQI